MSCAMPSDRHQQERHASSSSADEAERVEIVRRLLVRAGFAAKLAEPGVDPLTAPNGEIAELGGRYGHRYEAVRINLDGSATGPGGPGDLAWVLPLVGAGVLAVALGRMLRRRR